MTYFEERLKSLNVKREDVFLPEDLRTKEASVHVCDYFSEDEHGNIVIRYFMPEGGPYTFAKDGAKWNGIYTRKRLHPKNATEQMRYSSPKGGGVNPFLPPRVLRAWQTKKPIETLYAIEGEFKAFAADRVGVDIIGMPSIHGFYGEKNDHPAIKTLHQDIIRILMDCKVQNFVFLSDADTISVHWEKDKEMTKRPKSFYSAVKNFRSAAGYVMKDPDSALAEVYFCHIKGIYDLKAKGFDDLLEVERDHTKAIVNDLQKLAKAEKYFKCISITENYETRLKKAFGISSVKEFGKVYAADLDDKPFVYNNAVYINDSEGPKFLHHNDVSKYLRIGPNWMKMIEVPNKYSEPEPQLIPWNIGEIERDYKRFPGFVASIKKYDAFCNEPDWTDKYEREHNDCYNLANPIQHGMAAGGWPTIYRFLKHIFRGEGSIHFYENGAAIECFMLSDVFTVAMDWLNIAYRHPKSPLPVPILVSKEYNTGKSTFLKFMQAIFGANNMAILSNDLFKMSFNSHYITKQFIAIDESFLDVDKKAEKERLKQLVTADTAFLQNKGIDVKQFPYYAKVIMASNDADSVMKMDDQEDRWFVVKVPKIATGEKDPDMEMKMRKEIPAFLNFLNTRRIAHPRKDRLWFEPKHFITAQFMEIVANTKDFLEKQLEIFIEQQFLDFRQAQLHYDPLTLKDQLNDRIKWKLNENDIRDKLKNRYGLTPEDKPSRFKFPIGFENSNQQLLEVEGVHKINWGEKVGRYYTFEMKDWVNEDDRVRIMHGETSSTAVGGKNGDLLSGDLEDDNPF